MTAATSDLTFSKEKERLEDILITPVEAIGRDLTAGGRIDRWGDVKLFPNSLFSEFHFRRRESEGCVSLFSSLSLLFSRSLE